MTRQPALYLLGSPWLEIDDASIPLSSGSLGALAAYLALDDSGNAMIGRSRLAGTLWPEQSETQARRTLTSALYRLRRTLEPYANCLVSDSAGVGLHNIWVDVLEFCRLAASPQPADWAQAIELYVDELCPDYDSAWINQRRTTFHQLYLATLERLVMARSASAQYGEALLIAQRWVVADPLNEQGHATVMRLQARLGRYTAALRQYAQLQTLLDQELGIAPQPETQALVAQLRHELEVAQQRAAHQRSQAQVFVGRTAERAQALDSVELAATGTSGILLIEGRAGMGKTRLLQEVAASASWRGFNVVWGNASDQVTTPYAPLDHALSSLISGAQIAALHQHLSPVALEALAGLFPQLRTANALHLSTPPNLPAALSEGLHVLTQSAPLLIILDNVQWASPAFWQTLAFSRTHLAALGKLRLLIAMAYRPEELSSAQAAYPALNRLERELGALRIVLQGLSRHEAEELLQRLAFQRSLAVIDAELDALHALSGGNPLFLEESFIGRHQPQPTHASFNRLLEERLQQLSAPARAALEVAAVLGREWSSTRWLQFGITDLEQVADELIAARFLQHAHGRYAFHHDLIHEFVQANIAPERLRYLHRQMVTLLKVEQAAPAVLAWHSEQATDWDAARQFYLQAGLNAHASYAYSTALEYLNRAVALLVQSAQPGPADRLALLCARQRVLGIVGQVAAWRADIDAIEELATSLGDEQALLEALEARIPLLSLESDIPAMNTVAQTALALAQRLGMLAAEARILRLYGFHLLANASFPPTDTLPMLRRAVALAESLADYGILVSALCTLAFGECVMGQTTAAQQHAAQALSLTELHPELYPARADVLRVLANAALNRADWETARITMHRAIQQIQEQDDIWALAVALFMGVYLFGGMGQRAEADAAVAQMRALVEVTMVAPYSNWSLYIYAVGIDSALQSGDLGAAETIVSEIQGWLDTAPKSGAALYLLTETGALRLFQNRPHDALRHLREALPLWYAARTGFLPLLLTHALAAHLAGETAEAQESMRVAEDHYSSHEIAYCAVLFHFTRFWLRGSRQDLQSANEEIYAQAGRIRDDQLRADFLRNVRLHSVISLLWRLRPLAGTVRSVAGLWMRISREYTGIRVADEQPTSASLVRQTVRLARADAPLGKPLSDEERISVCWTLQAPDDQHIQDRTALRHQRLLRLLAEAAAQDGAPTDDDLAGALHVSRRTIIRDMAALASAGELLPTRRRKDGR